MICEDAACGSFSTMDDSVHGYDTVIDCTGWKVNLDMLDDNVTMDAADKFPRMDWDFSSINFPNLYQHPRHAQLSHGRGQALLRLLLKTVQGLGSDPSQSAETTETWLADDGDRSCACGSRSAQVAAAWVGTPLAYCMLRLAPSLVISSMTAVRKRRSAGLCDSFVENCTGDGGVVSSERPCMRYAVGHWHAARTDGK